VWSSWVCFSLVAQRHACPLLYCLPFRDGPQVFSCSVCIFAFYPPRRHYWVLNASRIYKMRLQPFLLANHSRGLSDFKVPPRLPTFLRWCPSFEFLVISVPEYYFLPPCCIEPSSTVRYSNPIVRIILFPLRAASSTSGRASSPLQLLFSLVTLKLPLLGC